MQLLSERKEVQSPLEGAVQSFIADCLVYILLLQAAVPSLTTRRPCLGSNSKTNSVTRPFSLEMGVSRHRLLHTSRTQDPGAFQLSRDHHPYAPTSHGSMTTHPTSCLHFPIFKLRAQPEAASSVWVTTEIPLACVRCQWRMRARPSCCGLPGYPAAAESP